MNLEDFQGLRASVCAVLTCVLPVVDVVHVVCSYVDNRHIER